MALAYLLDPTNQYQNVAGVNNVAGWFEVFISDTPERADVYVDFAGTRAPERIGIDNDGRAVMIVDSEGVYRVEMHAPNGDLLWTQYPVWPVGQGGSGAIGVDIGSSDGSVDVQRTQVGSVVNYDLSVAADSTDLLGWGEYVGYTMDGTHMVPTYSAGTIVAGQHGIRLQGGQYYHVTVALGASSVEQNVYDAFQVSFKGVDGEGAVSTFATKSFHYDASTGEGHSYDVSFDMMPATDVEMYAEATGLESGISVGLSEVYVHRVYSGAPAIPGGVADKEWVEDNYQEKLTAGNNITIENNIISATAEHQVQADWAQDDPNEVDYIKNKPTVDQVYDASSTNAQSGTAVAEAIAAADNLFIAVYGVTTIGEVNTAYSQGKDIICRYNRHGHLYSSQLSSLVSGIYTFTTTDGFTDYEFTLSPDGGTGAWTIGSRAIPSGTQLVPSATSADVGEVLTVNAQGTPEWAPAQAPISAGNGVDITNNVVSAKVDGTSITFNANGELEATVAPQVQSDWSQSDSTAVDYIKNKPDLSQYATTTDLSGKADKVTGATNGDIAVLDANGNLTDTGVSSANLVHDASYVHTDENFTSSEKTKLAGIETGAEVNVQSDWNESDSTSDSFIRNKPTIPVVPSMKELVAGANVTIAENTNSVTISATTAQQVNADWNATSGVAEILNKPSIPVLPAMKELVAGSGVTITESSTDVTISAAGTAYTAGTGIGIANDVISADTTVLALKSELPVIGTVTL